ncbi:unnamed protein product, partial [Effrenium voratum]
AAGDAAKPGGAQGAHQARDLLPEHHAGAGGPTLQRAERPHETPRGLGCGQILQPGDRDSRELLSGSRPAGNAVATFGGEVHGRDPGFRKLLRGAAPDGRALP